MQVSIFSCLKDKTPKDTSLDDIVRIMRSSEHLRNLCERRKELIKDGNKYNADLIKRKLLPAFAPNALMYGGKARRNITGLTDLCFLDIDHINDDEIEKVMCLLHDDSHIVLAARSMSGDGLHILVRYAFQGREQPWIGTMSTVRMNFIYGNVFTTIKNHYQELWRQKIDKEGGNMERLCTISYDENLLYNIMAEPIVLEYEKRPCSKKRQPYKILYI